MNILQILDNKYQQLDSFYNTASLPMKLMIMMGIAVVLILIGSVIVPPLYKSGQNFGEFYIIISENK